MLYPRGKASSKLASDLGSRILFAELQYLLSRVVGSPGTHS